MGLQIQTDMIRHGFDEKTCFVHFRGDRTKRGLFVMTTQKLILDGMDLFGALHTIKSQDGGKTWTQPVEEPAFVGQQDGENQLFCCDFVPAFHKKTQNLLGIGQTVRYTGHGILATPRERETCYSVYDDDADCFRLWKTLHMPDRDYYKNSGAGCAQRLETPDGDILLPFYFMAPDTDYFQSAIMQLCFDGASLKIKKISPPVCVDEKNRGAFEPSIAAVGGKCFMTLRTDEKGYVCVGDDAFSFQEIKPWQWEDGKEIGNYNTQQHFVTLNGHLYLVYTRRGAQNDHIFRHRAPLFIAQVDTKRLCLLKETERVVVPQRGARLGNFGVSQIDENEAWVTVTEWMQPIGCERFGSDNAFFIARIAEKE